LTSLLYTTEAVIGQQPHPLTSESGEMEEFPDLGIPVLFELAVLWRSVSICSLLVSAEVCSSLLPLRNLKQDQTRLLANTKE
jgi:hypothetical protein